jgi:hypothetical protein
MATGKFLFLRLACRYVAGPLAKPSGLPETFRFRFSTARRKCPGTGNCVGDHALLYMARNKKKPTIPEPSPRFFIVSLIAGFVLVAAVVGFSLAAGS